MEKRALLALVISFVIFIGFGYIQQKFYPPSPQKPATQPVEQPVEQPAAPKPAISPSPVATPTTPSTPPTGVQKARDIVVDTPLYQAIFTEQGARLKSFRLKKYWGHLPFQKIADFNLWFFGIDIQRYKRVGNQITDPKELVQATTPDALPLALAWETKAASVGAAEVYQADQKAISLTDQDKAKLSFTCVRPNGLTLVKTFTFEQNSYRLDLTATVKNQSSNPLEGDLALSLTDDFSEVKDAGFTGFAWSAKKSRDTVASGSLKESKMIGQLDWGSLESSYFMMAVVPPPSDFKFTATVQDVASKIMTATFRTQVASLPPGQEISLPYTLYFGPKDLDILKSLGLGLEQTVDFGWFQILALPLLYVLQFFFKYLHNYGWAIIVMTFLIRVLFLYPNHKSYQSMKDMQKLQPKIAKLREKYKDDREALNKELMGLYRTYKVNPMGGCLPMILQLPVFIALYNILGYAIELRHAPFISTLPFTDIVWLADLSAKDPLLITPIIMGATMFIQQKMTPSPGDPTQAKLMLMMPIIFTFMFLNFASGLVLYWLLNNVLSIIQQYYTNKYMP
ncbi:membrane protein insertase YidC [Desulfobacca acetoxidans]|uniref:Membrane protein insertase YidC n=1 Tax=Desulfobacca acetoxidans (strain ATCC 700848 / DSM 11109 / ASRB2) TaxID=880072 RepID=F2NGV7_DESAR|nr:membrane protein insertase YidC [Desulfobacca acetoxidans]AEB08728.1 Membrane protein oxaA [Desulfobacca acetoxidans DSM 11109]